MNIQLNLQRGMSSVGFLSALLDSNLVPKEQFVAELKKMTISEKVHISIREEYPDGKKATRLVVIDREKLEHGAKVRSVGEATKLLVSCRLPHDVELKAVGIFQALQDAAKAENAFLDVEEYFENANVFLVLGICLYLKMANITTVFAQNICIGSGFTAANMHITKVPRPVCRRLLSNFNTISGQEEGELIDPLFAAILNVLCVSGKIIGGVGEIVTANGMGDYDYLSAEKFYKIIIATEKQKKDIEVQTMSNYEDKFLPSDELERPANLDDSISKIDKIMSAMEDLEKSLKEKKNRLEQEKKTEKAVREYETDEQGYKDNEPTKKPFTDYLAERAQTQSNDFALNQLYKIKSLEDKLIQSSKRKQEILEEEKQRQEEHDLEPKQETESQNSIIELTSNIDNSTGEELGYLAELIMANGAYDVYFVSIFTNAFKPAYKLTALVAQQDLSLFSKLILLNSGAVRVKYTTLSSIDAKTRRKVKDGKFGEVDFIEKEGRNAQASYEDRKKIAKKYNLTLQEVERILGEDYE